MVDISPNLNKSSALSQFLRIFEPVFTIAAFFVFSKGILILIATNGASQGGDSDPSTYNFAVINLSLLATYLVTFSLLVLRWRKVLAVLIKDKYISVYLGIALTSYFWSDFPQDTLKHGISAIGATAFGLYLGTRYTIKEQVKFLYWTFILIIITSVLLAIVIPKYAFMSGVHAGAFRGIFGHKNYFGPIMIVGLLIFLIKVFERIKHNLWLNWFYVFTCIVLIVLSRSGNATLMLAIMLCLFFISLILRSRYEIMISTFLTFAIIGLVGITWFSSNQAVFFAAIGEDPSLTGRTEIWGYIWDTIQQRPWLGYGYKGFWHHLDGASAYVNLAYGPYGPGGIPHAHNGFLEVLLATGFVGLSIFLTGFVINFFKAIVLIRTNRDMDAFWPLLYFTYIIVANIAETTLGSFANLRWIIYSAICFSLLNPQSQYLKDNKSSSSE